MIYGEDFKWEILILLKCLINSHVKLKKESNEDGIDPTLHKQRLRSLRYLCNTKLDITYGVGLVSRFIKNPKQSHLLVRKKEY